MIWIAALMMAAQTGGVAGASQSSPAVTAQQKQELSNYNKSSGSKAKSVDSYPASPSTSADQSKAHRAVLLCWRDGGREGF
jgi:hypothetical protein